LPRHAKDTDTNIYTVIVNAYLSDTMRVKSENERDGELRRLEFVLWK